MGDRGRSVPVLLAPSAPAEGAASNTADRGIDVAWDRTMLALCALALLLAVVLEVRPGGRGLRAGSWPVPGQACLSKALFGWDCPGCGLTRSFIHLAHGRWDDALRFHRAGWLLFAATLFQIPWRAARLWRGRPYTPAAMRWAQRGGVLLLVSLIGNWLYNVWAGAPPLP